MIITDLDSSPLSRGRRVNVNVNRSRFHYTPDDRYDMFTSEIQIDMSCDVMSCHVIDSDALNGL